MILQLSFKLSTVNPFVMKKLENKETCFSKRRESCYFPSRKTRAVHGLEVRFPAKKERYPPPSRAVFQCNFRPAPTESVRLSGGSNGARRSARVELRYKWLVLKTFVSFIYHQIEVTKGCQTFTAQFNDRSIPTWPLDNSYSGKSA